VGDPRGDEEVGEQDAADEHDDVHHDSLTVGKVADSTFQGST
jgi:hypothetical protein